MAGFDIEKFKQGAVTGAMDDHYTPPAAGVYKASIAEIDGRETTSTKDPSKTFTVMTVAWELEDLEGKIKALTGRDATRVYQDIFLDIAADGKIALGTGKNIGLGALRTALGQNDPKVAWAPSKLIGAKGTVKVAQEKFNRRDGGDGMKAIVESVAPYNAPQAGAVKPAGMPSR